MLLIFHHKSLKDIAKSSNFKDTTLHKKIETLPFRKDKKNKKKT
jgi:hypothetical protein